MYLPEFHENKWLKYIVFAIRITLFELSKIKNLW